MKIIIKFSTVIKLTCILVFTLISVGVFSQISNQSTVHKPSDYTPAFDFRLFRELYNERSSQNIPVSKGGMKVKEIYNQYNQYPPSLSKGWHKIYAVAENNGIPFNYYSGWALLKDGGDLNNSSMFISDLKLGNQKVDFELSADIVNCRSNVLWSCGSNGIGETIYCGLDIYFLDDLIEYNTSAANNRQPSENTNSTPAYGSSDFYNGYQIVDFAKQVNFKPRNHKFSEWEHAVITVFSTKEGSYANSRQINIDAMYLCHNQPDVMYRRYCELYGSVNRSVFNKYCRLFILLLKTDEQ